MDLLIALGITVGTVALGWLLLVILTYLVANFWGD